MSAANQSNMQSCTFLPKCFCPLGMPKSSNNVQATPLRTGNQYTETGNSGFKQLLLGIRSPTMPKQTCIWSTHRMPAPLWQKKKKETHPVFHTADCFRLETCYCSAGGWRGGCGGGEEKDPAFSFSGSIYFKSIRFSSGNPTGNLKCNQ